MRILRLVAILMFAAIVVLVQHFGSGSSSTSHVAASSTEYTEAQKGIPQKAYWVLKIIRETGHAPEGYVGGRTFQNREGRLPSDGEYREFDVDPHDGHRNAERIIVEWRTKQAWYTGDHYENFIPMP